MSANAPRKEIPNLHVCHALTLALPGCICHFKVVFNIVKEENDPREEKKW